MGDSFVGIQARLMSQALRKLTGAVSRSNTALVFTNQLREKIGVMFGNPETTPGGRALKFYASRPPGHPAHRDDQDRHRVGRQPGPRQGREEQGRAAVPRRRVRRDVRRGHLARRAACSTSASRWTSSTKTGAWFTFGETRLGQGREASKEFLKGNPDDRRGDRAPDPRQDHRGRPPRRGHRRGRVARRDAARLRRCPLRAGAHAQDVRSRRLLADALHPSHLAPS